MKVIQLSDISGQELLDGAVARFVHADTMTIAYWSFEPGAPLPEHSHPHEQVTNVLNGVFELTVEGETTRLGPDSVAVIPCGAVHSGEAVTRCRIIDVFHPVREDYR